VDGGALQALPTRRDWKRVQTTTHTSATGEVSTCIWTQKGLSRLGGLVYKSLNGGKDAR